MINSDTSSSKLENEFWGLSGTLPLIRLSDGERSEAMLDLSKLPSPSCKSAKDQGDAERQPLPEAKSHVRRQSDRR